MITSRTYCGIFVLILDAVFGYIEIEASSNACYDSRSRTFNSCSGQYDDIFYAPYNGTIEGVKLLHNSGAVQCYTYYHNYYTLSNWGLCEHVGVIIMSVSDPVNFLGDILYPVNGETDGLYYWFPFSSYVNDNDDTIPNSYEISGYDQESDYLYFVNPKYKVSHMDKFMLQYTEAYVQSSHGDNVGVGYASVYFLYSDIITLHPSTQPTNYPTSIPSVNPTSNPTIYPTVYPTTIPSAYLTNIPTSNPTNYPTSHPTAIPSVHPTNYPTNIPSSHPTTVYPALMAIPAVDGDGDRDDIVIICIAVISVVLIVIIVYLVWRHIKLTKQIGEEKERLQEPACLDDIYEGNEHEKLYL